LRRTNLLPPEERRGRRPIIPTATRTGVIGILLILGALLVMIMIGLYLYYFVRLGNEEEQITQLEQDIARQQARVQELAPFQNL
jgi:Tfp pilus assembly protein PilN